MIAKKISFILLIFTLQSFGQHLYQVPKPLQKKSIIEEIIGPLKTEKPSKKLKILWVYGFDKYHIPGAHDYVKVKDLMTGLLEKVPDVSVEAVFHFPTKIQFESADLVVMYLHLPKLTEPQYANFQSYLKRGGGVVALHEAAIMRPPSEGKKLSKCLGCAWNEGHSQWGAIFDKVTIKNEHEIFKGFPKKLEIRDEFYWQLFQEESVNVLGSVKTGPAGNSEGPIVKEKLSEKESPLFWTYELGKGKVFGTTTGHHTFTYYDPEFRIILFRGMSWAMNEKADPFMPLVFEGITNKKGLVGISETMRHWKGKRRK